MQLKKYYTDELGTFIQLNGRRIYFTFDKNLSHVIVGDDTQLTIEKVSDTKVKVSAHQLYIKDAHFHNGCKYINFGQREINL
jgi:hypothetical protein